MVSLLYLKFNKIRFHNLTEVPNYPNLSLYSKLRSTKKAPLLRSFFIYAFSLSLLFSAYGFFRFFYDAFGIQSVFFHKRFRSS